MSLRAYMRPSSILQRSLTFLSFVKVFAAEISSSRFCSFAFYRRRWFNLFFSIVDSRSFIPFRYISFSLFVFADFGGTRVFSGIAFAFFMGTLGIGSTGLRPKFKFDGLILAEAFSASISAFLRNYSTLWNFWQKKSSILSSFSTSASGSNLVCWQYLSIDHLGLTCCMTSLPFRVKAGLALSYD